jgi:phosphatidyl-myo-inositol dimannoside synthase
VRVGEAVGFPGIDGQGSSVVKASGLRVLALVPEAFGGRGGIAQYNRDFLGALARCDGVAAVIVLPRFSASSVSTLPPGIRQLRPVESKVGYALSALWTTLTLEPIDFVFCGHLWMAPLAAGICKVFNVPLWLQVHGAEVFWHQPSTLERRSVETALIVTAVSRYTRRHLLQRVGIEPARVKVLSNTVDPQYRPGPKPAYLLERHAAAGKMVLMTVSRLSSFDQYKGHDRVIRALPRVLEQHPDTIYLIVGDGDGRPRLEAQALQYGVAKNVHFPGLVPPEELPDYLRLADVFVMPSTGEGFGIVFLEAMATGVHVIGGNRDGSADALADGELGWAVDPDDEHELTSAISAALSTPANLDPAKVNCVSRFSYQAFAKHLQALVESNFTAPN